MKKELLDAFKKYLDECGIPYRAGKGEYQVLQVCTPDSGWQVIFSNTHKPNHYTVNDKLMPLVHLFQRSQSK